MAKKSTAKESGAGVDATELLKEDHRRVKELVDQFKKLSDSDVDKKEELVREACLELKIHAQLEEEVFYPAMRESLDDSSLVDEAEVEHASAKSLIEQLEEMEPEDELFDAKFKVLGEYVMHHVEEEENEMFPLAKRAKVDMKALGEELAARKQELQAELADE